MQASILKRVLRIITEEYEVFSHLALRSRIAAVSALTLLYFTLVILTHLTIYPYIISGPRALLFLTVIYGFVLIIAILTILPILFPRLQQKSSLAMFTITFFNFFPLVILTFVIPGLRKYKTAILAVTVYLSIGVTGVVIMYTGTSEGILSERPDDTAIVLWLIGIISIFFSIFIYGFVTEKISAEKIRIETEVKIAQNIQRQLVPVVDLREKSFELFGITGSAYQIGGDFFDVIRLSKQKILVAIGDVSGHNIAAGLLMAIAKGAFRTAVKHTSSLAELAASMNHTIMENSNKKMFVSFKCGEIDLKQNSINFVNAGHLPLLHFARKDNRVLEYNADGLALGLSAQAVYACQQRYFENGDQLVLLTDGIIEASNAAGEEFGYNRVKNLLEQHAAQLSPKHLHEKLMSDLNAFTASASLKDDATYLAVHIK